MKLELKLTGEGKRWISQFDREKIEAHIRDLEEIIGSQKTEISGFYVTGDKEMVRTVVDEKYTENFEPVNDYLWVRWDYVRETLDKLIKIRDEARRDKALDYANSDEASDREDYNILNGEYKILKLAKAEIKLNHAIFEGNDQTTA